MDTIGIIGAGAWGTALAAVAQRAGPETSGPERRITILARELEVARDINNVHRNAVYLPDVELDPAITATTDPARAMDADVILLASPAQHLRQTCQALAAHWKPDVAAVICAKGIEQRSCKLMSEVVAETLPQAPVAVLSGPTFAAEVARGLPAAATLAAESEGLGRRLAKALTTPRFRIYRSGDVIGAQIGGAVKNVLAIGCGMVRGRGLGDNAGAALITRGLAEMVRLAAAKGGKMETLMGLSGLGDLTLTCNAMQSRNFSLGVALGEGQTLDHILAIRRSVAEGVFSAASVTGLAGRLGVDMPLCQAVDGILNHRADMNATIEHLLSRPPKAEDPFANH